MEKRDVDKFWYIGVGGMLMFVTCLLIGVLDHYNYLDKILDFLHLP